MHIGDRLYRINDDGELETLIIIGISEELDEINFEIDWSTPRIKPRFSMNLTYVKMKKGKEIFDSPGDALKYRDRCIANFHDRILREALHSIHLDEVMKNGKELRSSMVFDYPGKNTRTATLYEYKDKLYVAVKERDVYTNATKCILFREVEKGVNA